MLSLSTSEKLESRVRFLYSLVDLLKQQRKPQRISILAARDAQDVAYKTLHACYEQDIYDEPPTVDEVIKAYEEVKFLRLSDIVKKVQ